MLPDNFDQSLRSFHPIDKGVCKFSLIHLLVRDGNNAAARTILSKSFRKELPRAPRHRVTHGSQYLLQMDKSVKTTSERSLALVMGKYTAQDAIDSIQSARCVGELIPVKIPA